MVQRRLWTIGCVLAVLLVFPRDSRAGIWEFIIEMSGPQMIGGMTGCLVNFNGEVHHCSIVGVPVGWPRERPRDPAAWLVLQSGAYVSTGKDANNSNFKFGRVGMLTADPMIAFSSKLGYHAIGGSYNFLFSEQFVPVHNFGLKLQPIGVHLGRLDLEYTLRLYPNGFDVIESTDPAVLVRGREFEAVHGISASLHF